MDAFKNFVLSLIAVAPSPALSGTSITVTTADGAIFPATPFNAVIFAVGQVPIAANAEIVRVTAIVGDVLTITRAQEGSSARAIIVGDTIVQAITNKVFTDINAKLKSGIDIAPDGVTDPNTNYTAAGPFILILRNSTLWYKIDPTADANNWVQIV